MTHLDFLSKKQRELKSNIHQRPSYRTNQNPQEGSREQAILCSLLDIAGVPGDEASDRSNKQRYACDIYLSVNLQIDLMDESDNIGSNQYSNDDGGDPYE